ncbi:MAG: hypothetical protein GY793_01965 [Proteobacteria bacterium]|nr:hypothetical protein [Pseudomonadota bacterium]
MIVSSVCIIGSTITTGGGLWFSTINKSPTVWKLSVFCIAITILPVALIGIWKLLGNVANIPPKLDTIPRRILSVFTVVFLIALLISTTFCASTTTSVIGMGGDVTNQAHYVSSVIKLEETLRQMFEFKMHEQSVIKEFNEQKREWNQKAVRASKGKLTGTDGKGALFNYLKGLEGLYPIIKETELQEISSAIQELSERVTNLRMELKSTPSENFRGDSKECADKINVLCKDINLFSESGQLKAISIVARMMASNNMKTESPEGTSEDLVAKQQAKIEEAIKTLAQNKESLEESLAEAKRLKPKSAFFETLNPFESVVVYWKSIYIFWALWILIDSIPIACFMLHFSFGDRLIYEDEAEEK